MTNVSSVISATVFRASKATPALVATMGIYSLITNASHAISIIATIARRIMFAPSVHTLTARRADYVCFVYLLAKNALRMAAARLVCLLLVKSF